MPAADKSMVYPRVCGGTTRIRKQITHHRGLSPRVRGNHTPVRGFSRPHRSIPACAGEPCRESPPPPYGRVYPRVCGGTRRPGIDGAGLGGLSPRVRGNLNQSSVRRIIQGSIPACAGEPSVPLSPTHPPLVYPRVCGGTAGAVYAEHNGQGLSPRVRGNRGGGRAGLVGKGSIPACAGEPLPYRPQEANYEVYPRVCGGTVCLPTIAIELRGLSPRVRGNLVDVGGLVQRPRSIPACAGEPLPSGRPAGRGRVYPRVCGGTGG